MGDRTIFGGGGSGEPFNGGTITDGLVIDTDDVNELPLEIRPQADQVNDIVNVYNGAGELIFSIDDTGLVDITPQAGVNRALRVFVPSSFGGPLANFQWGGAHIIAIGGTDASGDACLFVNGATGQTVDLFYVVDQLGLGMIQVTYDRKLGFFNKAPVVQAAANPDTSGATLAALETEVNQLKQLLRDYGLLAS